MESPVETGALMREIERDVRERRRRWLAEHGGATEYLDEALFDRVDRILRHAVDARDHDALLLPKLLNDDDADWRLTLSLRSSSHRRILGRLILLAKRRVLLPLTRWLFEYSQENFRRQQRVNLVLFACLEELAIENARLRRDLLDRLRQ